MKKKNKSFSIPIRWVENPRRLSGLFVKEHEGRIKVHGLGETISFNCRDGEDPEEVRLKVGELLAGKPVGQTYKILQEHFGTDEGRELGEDEIPPAI